MPLINDADLDQLLSGADPEDLSILADFITDKGEGRISLSADVCKLLHSSSQARNFSEEARAFIAEELQRFGGNSLMNLFRGGTGVSYKEIVRGVADHMKVTYSKKDDTAQIEMAILLKILAQSVEKMSEEQKKTLLEEFGMAYAGAGAAIMATLIATIRSSGPGVFKLSAVVANASVTALLGRGLVMGTSGTVMRGIGALAGPLGWVITAIWTVFDLASPAYRVTVPCVIQLAYMRQKALARLCGNCSATLSADARFCSRCGHPTVLPMLRP